MTTEGTQREFQYGRTWTALLARFVLGVSLIGCLSVGLILLAWVNDRGLIILPLPVRFPPRVASVILGVCGILVAFPFPKFLWDWYREAFRRGRRIAFTAISVIVPDEESDGEREIRFDEIRNLELAGVGSDFEPTIDGNESVQSMHLQIVTRFGKFTIVRDLLPTEEAFKTVVARLVEELERRKPDREAVSEHALWNTAGQCEEHVVSQAKYHVVGIPMEGDQRSRVVARFDEMAKAQECARFLQGGGKYRQVEVTAELRDAAARAVPELEGAAGGTGSEGSFAEMDPELAELLLRTRGDPGAYVTLETQSCWYLKHRSLGSTAAKYIAAELEGPAASSVGKELEVMFTPWRPGWAGFRKATPEDVQTLLRAVQRARGRMEREGRPANWPHGARQFPRLVAALGELVEYIGADPRVSGGRQSCAERLQGRKFKFVYFWKSDSGPPVPRRAQWIAAGEAMAIGCGAALFVMGLMIPIAGGIGAAVGAAIGFIGWGKAGAEAGMWIGGVLGLVLGLPVFLGLRRKR